MTPLRTEQWSATWAAENAGIIGDLHALADPGADKLLGWDESANNTIGFTLGAGLSFSTTTLNLASAVAGAGLTMTSQVLNVIGGDGITANANDIALSSSVAGDGLAFSSGVLSVGVSQGIELSGDAVTMSDQSVSSTVPIKLTAGVLGWDSASITELVGSGVSQSADGFLLDDAGVLKVVPYDQMAIITGTQDAAQTFALTDVNTIQTLTGSTNRIWTIPKNTTVAIEVGAVIICHNSGTGNLTLTAATDVIIDSVFHAAAATAQSDRVLDGGTAVLIKIATDTWALSGDIADS